MSFLSLRKALYTTTYPPKPQYVGLCSRISWNNLMNNMIRNGTALKHVRSEKLSGIGIR